jgi:hypothetical protein
MEPPQNPGRFKRSRQVPRAIGTSAWAGWVERRTLRAMSDSPQEIVRRAYDEFMRHRDVDAVLRYFREGAQWHAVTPTPFRERSTSISVREYWEESNRILDNDMRGWTPHEVNAHAHGPFVINHVRSSHGEGLMIYRVVDGLIADIWAINALGPDTPGVF